MRIKAIILTGVVLAGCAGSSPMTAEKVRVRPSQTGDVLLGDAQSYYLQARAQLAAGNAALAIDGFRKALRVDPRSIDALNGLGAAYDRVGRFDLSRNYYEQALGLDPKSRMTLNNYGYSLAMQGKLVDARQLLAQASAGDSGTISAIARHNIVLLDIPPKSESVSASVAEAKASISRPWVERLTTSTQLIVTRLVRSVKSPEITSVSMASGNADNERPSRFAPEYHRQRLALLDTGALTKIASDEVTSGQQRDVSLVVLNGVGRRGMAGRMAGFLAAKGYSESRVGDASNMLPRTEVVYPKGLKDKAAAVAAHLPFQVVLRSSTSVRAVTVRLGSDARQFDDRLHGSNRTV